MELCRAEREATVVNEPNLGRRLRLWIGAIVTILVSWAAFGSEPETDSSADLPEAYGNNYLVAASTLSPDKRLAVIYPKRDPEEFPKGKDYIVSLQPFAVLGSLDTKWPYFYHENHAGISAEWSSDSSIALVTIDSKWGPGDIFLLEFADGKLKRATNLLAKIHALLLPDYRKVKPRATMITSISFLKMIRNQHRSVAWRARSLCRLMLRRRLIPSTFSAREHGMRVFVRLGTSARLSSLHKQ